MITPEQLLTDQNNLIREFVKELIQAESFLQVKDIDHILPAFNGIYFLFKDQSYLGMKLTLQIWIRNLEVTFALVDRRIIQNRKLTYKHKLKCNTGSEIIKLLEEAILFYAKPENYIEKNDESIEISQQ